MGHRCVADGHPAGREGRQRAFQAEGQPEAWAVEPDAQPGSLCGKCAAGRSD